MQLEPRFAAQQAGCQSWCLGNSQDIAAELCDMLHLHRGNLLSGLHRRCLHCTVSQAGPGRGRRLCLSCLCGPNGSLSVRACLVFPQCRFSWRPVCDHAGACPPALWAGAALRSAKFVQSAEMHPPHAERDSASRASQPPLCHSCLCRHSCLDHLDNQRRRCLAQTHKPSTLAAQPAMVGTHEAAHVHCARQSLAADLAA